MISMARGDELTALMGQTVRVFRIYNHYRVVVGLVVVGALFFDFNWLATLFRSQWGYQIVTVSYLALNVFIAFLLLAGFKPSSRHISLSLAIDILLLHALMFCSTGVQSGFANLVVIGICAANIMLRGRQGIAFAALAALLSLLIEAERLLRLDSAGDGIVQAGLLGAIYFTVAFILQSIAKRVSASEQLARERAQNIIELEKLNHQIIQHMRTGIVVVNEVGQVRLANESAVSLLAGDTDRAGLQALPDELRMRMDQWKQNQNQRTSPFRGNPNRAAIQANFSRLQRDTGHDLLIYLEDTSKITQQAQQLKLASLGRLTAGIAHEIRNPLGAMSHAAQLLMEADYLQAPERKMVEIIQRHSKRVNGIVENVLDLSRRQQPNAELTSVNLWLTEFVQEYEEGIGDDSSISLNTSDERIMANFDRSQIEQVMTNLFDNGLRYSKKANGQGAISVTTGITVNDRAYIDIIDNGTGIESENLPHLFEPFFTTDSSGTGLGLYLSRELCEINQAQLDLLPRQERGCHFRVTFSHPKRIV